MRIIGNKELPSQYKFGLFYLDEAAFTGKRDHIDVGPCQRIELPPSGETGVKFSGLKCEHGVYIPHSLYSDNRAEYCSICNPYIIEVSGEDNGSDNIQPNPGPVSESD